MADSRDTVAHNKIDQLLDYLDRNETCAELAPQSEGCYSYRRYQLKVDLVERGGTSRSISVVTRRLGRDFLCMLHSGFVHPGTECGVQLITIENAWMTIRGTVCHCALVGGRLHEIIMRFDSPIDPARFVPIQVAARVLLAEDSLAISQMTCFILDKIGAETVVVDSGETAIQKATEEDFDIILMDVDMPGRNGLDATRILRERHVLTPIIAFTVLDGEDDRRKCLEAGCTDYLAKPVERHKLVDAVRKYAENRSAVHSTLASDAEMEELIDAFVDDLPRYLCSAQKSLREEEYSALPQSVRQIKGGCRTYGFGEHAERAREIETLLLILDGSPSIAIPPHLRLTNGGLDHGALKEELHQRFEDLLALGRRVRKGTPGPQNVAH